MNQNQLLENKNVQLTGKLVVLAVLIGVTWLATMFVWGVLQDREYRQVEASQEVSEQWSRSQVVAGPVLTVPVEKTAVTAQGERVTTQTTLTLLPKSLSYESNIETQVLQRGVYEVPVYTTEVKGAGSFDLTDIDTDITDSMSTRILWDKAVVSINVSDTRGISSQFDILFNEKQYPLLPSSEFTSLDRTGVHASVVVLPTQPNYEFSFTLPLKGSREIAFLPLGENTRAVVRSFWNAPSFTGEFLPEERSVTEEGFEASWNVASYGKNLPQYWLGETAVESGELLSKAFGVGLYQEVDFYTMVNRSVKYSILFISLTFLTFFLYEVLVGLRIHPMQYLLVGFAIALFYLLLLSFAELIGFMSAYILSTGAITLLLSAYSFSVLRAKKRAFSITALCVALYGYLYILLQLDELSLVFGSVLLFGVLATVMYITRNIDWYSLSKNK
jgi:inner membrane protein